MKKYLIFTLTVLFLISNVAVASIVEKTIAAKGVASSRSEAINEAILEAISQVNGKKIASESELKLREVLVDSNGNSQAASSEEYKKKISEATNGVILGYRIKSEHHNPNGLWELELDVNVVSYQTDKSSLRKRIVIAEIKTEKLPSSINGLSRDKLVGNYEERLSTEFVGARKFAILDRKNNQLLEKELALALSDKVNIRESVRRSNLLVADYILVVNLESIYYQIKEKTSRLDNTAIQYATGSARSLYQLIDVATGQIVSSNTVSASLQHSSHQIVSNEAALNLMLMQMSQSVSKKVHEQIYPIALVDYSDGKAVLNQGTGIKVGSRYRVYSYSGTLYDPYTKEAIGKKESYCCDILIDRVTPKQAYGTIVKNDVFFKTTPFELKKFIVRESVPSVKNTHQQDRAKKINTIKEEMKNDDDW